MSLWIMSRHSDDAGRTLFCFVTPDGLESRRCTSNPGDTLNITPDKPVPASPRQAGDAMSVARRRLRRRRMDATSVNMHFHGTDILADLPCRRRGAHADQSRPDIRLPR